MRTQDAFPSRFIKASDIGDAEVVATISKVEIEDIGDDRKAVVYFVGKEKGLVCNRTNWDRIALAAGTDETDEWQGLKIMLFTKPVTFNGKTAPATGQIHAAASDELIQRTGSSGQAFVP